MITSKEKRGKYYIAAFAALFVTVFVFSIATGRYPIPFREVVRVFISRLIDIPQTWTNEMELVIFRIRMPRVLAGALVGAALSSAGAAFQGLFRNPLVSPDVLGASSGAGFGAALMLLFGMNYAMVSLAAFVSGVIAVGGAYLISIRARRNPTLGMVLAGIMISSLFTAGTSYVRLVADPNNVLPAITFWLMGSVANVRQSSLIWAAIPILGGMLVLLACRWKLNLLTTGEDEARAMGVNTKVMRIVIVSAATLITAASVAISGIIGWVGLVIPHFARMLVGYDYRVMMPVSMLMGATFLMLVDVLARTIAIAEVPLGVLTAFVGAPFFLYLILDRGNRI
ncbi:MAG: iron ABC transporter permease [Oscillospiraceae bacterium]|nr:iron ABC transporter permease [Oscillospiraceae bacterium]